MPTSRSAYISVALLLVACGPEFAHAGPAALEDKPADKEAVQACEKRLCTLILKKPAKGEDLKCKLAKTWGKDRLKSGAASSRVNWAFGDARCTVSLNVPRETIVSALTKPAYEFKVPEHAVECQVVQGGEIEQVQVTLAPKIAFKDGEAKTVWLNVKNVKGPGSIKALIWATAQLEDKLGIFHRPMLKEINKFVQKKCAERYPE